MTWEEQIATDTLALVARDPRATADTRRRAEAELCRRSRAGADPFTCHDDGGDRLHDPMCHLSDWACRERAAAKFVIDADPVIRGTWSHPRSTAFVAAGTIAARPYGGLGHRVRAVRTVVNLATAAETAAPDDDPLWPLSVHDAVMDRARAIADGAPTAADVAGYRGDSWAHVHVTAPDGARSVAAAAAELELVGHLPDDATTDVQSVHSCSPRFTGQPVRYHVLIRVTSVSGAGWSIGTHDGPCSACARCESSYPDAPDGGSVAGGAGTG